MSQRMRCLRKSLDGVLKMLEFRLQAVAGRTISTVCRLKPGLQRPPAGFRDNLLAMLAMVSMLLSAPLQAALASRCRCDCCAEVEAAPGNATHSCDPCASDRPDGLQTADAVQRTPADYCPCGATIPRPKHGMECRCCTGDTPWRSLGALRARLANLKKKGKHPAPILAPDCSRRAESRIAPRRLTPDWLLLFMPATERCALLCRFLF